MEDALIATESRSSSEIPLVRMVSRVSLSPPDPAEPPASGPGGANNAALASGEPVQAMPMRSVSAPATGTTITDEDVSKLDLAITGCTISLLMPMAITIGGLGWEPQWKVLYGGLMIVSFVSTIVAFLTAWRPAVGWARRLSPFLARFGLVLAAALFVIFLSCRLARFGCVSGVAAAAAVVVILVLVWVLSGLPKTTEATAEEVVPGSLPPEAP